MKILKKLERFKENKLLEEYLLKAEDELKNHQDKISSILLFGSLARGDHTPMSDVDLLIVFKNSTNNEKITEIDKKLTKIEKEFNYAEEPEGITEELIYSLKRKTGMFVSHFVCTEKDIEERNFSKIFSTESFMSSLIAPSNLVLNNMSNDSLTLYGKNMAKDIQQPVNTFSMIKSLIMNLLTSLGSAVISPFYKKSTELSAEAMKWTLLATHQYMTEQSEGAENIIKFLKNHEIYTSETLEEFKSLRKRLEENPSFVFRAPFIIIKLHFEAIKERGI